MWLIIMFCRMMYIFLIYITSAYSYFVVLKSTLILNFKVIGYINKNRSHFCYCKKIKKLWGDQHQEWKEAINIWNIYWIYLASRTSATNLVDRQLMQFSRTKVYFEMYIEHVFKFSPAADSFPFITFLQYYNFCSQLCWYRLFGKLVGFIFSFPHTFIFSCIFWHYLFMKFQV